MTQVGFTARGLNKAAQCGADITLTFISLPVALGSFSELATLHLWGWGRFPLACSMQLSTPSSDETGCIRLIELCYGGNLPPTRRRHAAIP